MIVLLVILAILVLLALLRFGVIAVYDVDGVRATLVAGPARIVLYPSKPRSRDAVEKKKTKKTKRQPQKAKTAKEEKAKKPGALRKILELLPGVFSALKKFKRKLRINRLTIYYGAAGAEDPYKAAMQFGYVSAGMGVLVPFFENNFRIRKRDFRSNVDFTAVEPTVYVEAKLTIAVWEIFYIAISFLIFYMKTSGKHKNRKVVT